jgi:ketosteroid isomerase-like protein
VSANAEVIEKFYRAFSSRDAEGMVALYHDDARFSDPVFVDLDADGVRNMWRMLIARGKDLEVEYSGIEADERAGRAHWEATYTFSATGRRVHNVIDAEFEFSDDGKILVHKDTFDFHRWARMALGPTGLLLGWTSFLQNKVRAQARSGLEKFTAR